VRPEKKDNLMGEIIRMDGNGFVKLVGIIDELLGPDGCPWDRKQTVGTLSHMLLEEAYEAIDAADDEDSEKLADEMGDVWITTLMIAKAAERESRFSWDQPFFKAAEKLIRRHPHIFDHQKKLTPEEIEKQWLEVKKKEKKEKKNSFDGITNSLPILSKVQKLILRAKWADLSDELCNALESPSNDKENEFGRSLARLVYEAENAGVQAEMALRKFCVTLLERLSEAEKTF